MKSIKIIFNVAIEDDVLAILHNCDIKHYTKWPRVVGQGAATGARMDNHVWPGANAVIETVVNDDKAKAIMDTLQKLRDSPAGKQAGIYAYMVSVERVLE